MPHKQDAPSFHRNKQPMLDVLTPLLNGSQKHVLEIASGSGQHGPFFTAALPNLVWWPSDISQDAIKSVNAWREHLEANAVQNPQEINVTSQKWRTGTELSEWPEKFDCVLSMNMIHIAPYAATSGIIEGAANRLSNNGLLVFYGPFKRDGKQTAPSNQSFDEFLRSRNVEWGIRDLEDVTEIAATHGLSHHSTTEMPANNFVVIFKATR